MGGKSATSQLDPKAAEEICHKPIGSDGEKTHKRFRLAPVGITGGKKERGAVILYQAPPFLAKRGPNIMPRIEEVDDDDKTVVYSDSDTEPDQKMTATVDTDIETEPDQEEEKKGRFDAKRKDFFLTYPQSGILQHEDLWDTYRQNWPMEVKGATITKEMHQDGHPHFHVYLTFRSAKRVRRADFFDVMGCHCNIVTKIKSAKAVQAYIMKPQADGRAPNVKFFGDHGRMDYSTPTNFRRRQEDHDAYLDTLRRATLEDYKGQDITMGSQVFKIDMTIKKRHLWIYGAPDQGKTSLIDEAIYKYKVFKRCPKPYCFEGFQDHDIVWYDDQGDITKDELCHMSNRYHVPTTVWGPTRNRKWYMPNFKNLLLIVCTNDMPMWLTEDWFGSRFCVWHVDANGTWTNIL